jgi:hypothetical protein
MIKGSLLKDDDWGKALPKAGRAMHLLSIVQSHGAMHAER